MIKKNRHGAGLPVTVPLRVQAIFDVAADAIVENGEKNIVLDRHMVGWAYLACSN